MEFIEATKKATQILNEEKARPTTSYVAAQSSELATAMKNLFGQFDLQKERAQRPRQVHESPHEFRLVGVNYGLLLALFSQVAVDERPNFVAFLLTRISMRSTSVNDLPLVTEFNIRTGNKQELIRFIGESSLSDGLLKVLTQLEETIALNFNLFSDDELEQLATTLRDILRRAREKNTKFLVARSGSSQVPNPNYDQRLAAVARQIAYICEGLVEECTQARYFYLKGALQQNANLEVNLDKTAVEGYLKNLGFSGPLLEALNAAEQDFRESATPFELKNCLGHLRSFLEELHEQASKPFATKVGVDAPKKWGESTDILRKGEFLSAQEQSLALALYTLISDKGVHPLIAEREYARLLRNVVVEYGLLFLTKLARSGIHLR